MTRSQSLGYTLVEILIVVTILGILAVVVIPKYADTAAETREAALTEDLQSVQRQIDRYKVDHSGRGPHQGANGSLDAANFVRRLTGRTDIYGSPVATGKYGPYLPTMPDNPFITSAKLAPLVTVGSGLAPRDGTTGWFFDVVSQKIAPNSKDGALGDFPVKGGTSVSGTASVSPAAALP